MNITVLVGKKKKILLGLPLLLLGLFLIFFSVLNDQTIQKPVPQTQLDQQVGEQKPKPAKIYIPKISKVLDISEGRYVEKRWIISETGVSYLVTSSIPGEGGNSVFYGHNKKNILQDLPSVVPGDDIYVIMDNGKFVKYTAFETMRVKPNQVEILNQTEDSRLTIYTCDGFLDQARFVVIGHLKV